MFSISCISSVIDSGTDTIHVSATSFNLVMDCASETIYVPAISTSSATASIYILRLTFVTS